MKKINNKVYNPVEKKNISNDTRIVIEKIEEYYNYTLDDVINTDDTEALDKPYIILNGEKLVQVEINNEYVELGAKAYYNGITNQLLLNIMI